MASPSRRRTWAAGSAQTRVGDGGAKAFLLADASQIVVAFEEDIEHFDPSARSPYRQSKEHRDRRVSELEVELHGGSGFPAQRTTCRQRIFECAALEKKLARRIDQIGDVRPDRFES